MWVIYDTDSGIELDRIEYWDEAERLIEALNAQSFYDHYDKRWEA